MKVTLRLLFTVLSVAAFLLGSGVLRAQEVWTSPDFLWDEVELEVPTGAQHRAFHFMTADDHGYVWIARDRIDRFDGLKFRTVPDFNTQLGQGEDLTLAPGPAGMLWFARHSATGSLGYHEAFTTHDQCLIEPHSMEIIRPEVYFKDRLPPVRFAEMNNIFCSAGGTDCYFGLKDGGMLRFSGGEWKAVDVVDKSDDLLLQHLSFAEDGRRWAVFPDRCLVYDEGGSLVHRFTLSKRSMASKFGGGAADALPYNKVSQRFHRTLLPSLSSGDIDEERLVLPPLIKPRTYVIPVSDGNRYSVETKRRTPYITDRTGREVVRFPNEQYHNLRLVDKQGRLWFATYEGFKVGYPRRRSINSFLDDADDPVSVRAIVAIGPDSLWLNTYSGGFKAARPKPGLVNPEALAVPHAGSTNLGLTKLPDGRLLSGQHSGYYLTIEPHNARITTKRADYRHVGELGTNYLLPVSDGSLWSLGNQGLLRRSVSGDWRLIRGAAVTNYNYAEETSEGVWVAGNRGILLVHPDGTTIRDSFPVLRDLRINHFARTADTFYLATDRGAVVWLRGSDDYKLINGRLPEDSREIHGIYRTNDDRLFYSTNNGIFRCDLTNGKHLRYTTRDGMPHNECNWLAHYRAANGTLYFGTIQGVAYFHPDSLPTETNRLPKAQLRYDHAELLQSEKGWRRATIARKRIHPAVMMRPSDAMLRLGLSLPGNSSLNGVRLRYRLRTDADEGDSDWIDLKEGYLRINRPAAGIYFIDLEATLANGTPVAVPLALRLSVLAPFYRRDGFIVSFVILALGSFYLFYRRRRQSYLDRQKELSERVAAATAQINEDRQVVSAQNARLTELNEEKRKLLMVIAHDLKGPFASLRGVGEKVRYLIERSDHKRLDEFSDDIEAVVNGCLTTLNNLLLVNGTAELTAINKRFNLYEELEEQLAFLEPMARLRRVELVFETEANDVELEGIPFAINSLFRNLVMNAIKFSPAGGRVTVSVDVSQPQVVTLSVSDRGIGMSRQQVDSLINQRETEWDPKVNATGLGWRVVRMVARQHAAKLAIISQLRKGATVTVAFPSPDPGEAR